MNKMRESSNRTHEQVRHLASQDLLQVEAWAHKGEPPLKQLIVEGLLSFGEEKIFDFGRLNILVGPNGSGKSNLIECLRILRSTPLDVQSSFRPEGFEDWLNNGLDRAEGVGTLCATLVVAEVEAVVRHELRLGPVLRSQAQLEELIENAKDEDAQRHPYFLGSYRGEAEIGEPGLGARGHRKLSESSHNFLQSILSQIRDREHYPHITALASLYSRIRLYSEWSVGHGNVLREASPAGDGEHQLLENLSNMPSVLNALTKTSTHDNIRSLLSQLKETYRDYLTRTAYGRIGLFLEEDPFKIPVSARRLSDGTLHFLALATVLLQGSPPPLICLDEPELGMHPDMIRMLAGMIIDASQKTQLIVSTHSEHLLTALQDKFDVLFAFNSDTVGSTVQRLTRDDYRAWRADHALGELWSSGEIGGVRY